MILSIFICFLFLGTVLTITVKKVNADEVDIDYQFIDNIVLQLTNEYLDYWQGREYGTAGERKAADDLKTAWDQNMPGYAPAVEDPIYISSTNVIDDKLVIASQDDYHLFINDQEIPKSPSKFQPIPCLLWGYRNINNREYILKKAPDSWYQELYGRNSQDIIQAPAPCFQINYYSLGGSDVSGELTYVQDYSSFHPEGETGIHLIEIDNKYSDDIFKEKIDQVKNANGTGFIIITDNPTFINTQITDMPGVAISKKDGEKLRQAIDTYDEVYVDSGEELSIYPFLDDGINTIYLIDMSKIEYYDSMAGSPYRDDGRGWKAIKSFFWKSLRLGDDYPPMDAFLFKDLSDKATFNFGINSMAKQPTKGYGRLLATHFRPGFMVSGALGSPLQDGDKIRFTIFSHKDPHVISYDVTGTIPGENPDVVVICGHYDTFWGQGAVDNSVGPAIMWGIGKWFYQNYYLNNIMPKYTIKCVAFAGEEYGDMGSQFWVYKYIEQQHMNVISVINVDTAAMNVPDIPFTPWVYTNGLGRYNQIMTAMDLPGYYAKTLTPWQDPAAYGRKAVCTVTDTREFKDYANDIIALERWPYQEYCVQWPGDLLVLWGDHRKGPTDTDGDTRDKIYYTDLHALADMVKDLATYCAVTSDLTFVTNPTYNLVDLDSDSLFDSVKVDFAVQTQTSCWGSAELCIYQGETALTKTVVQELRDIQPGEENNFEMTITLPPNATAGTYEVRLLLKDYNENKDAQSSQNLTLSPYMKPMADFTSECDTENSKLFSFTDLSLASPDANITSWNWSFGDGNYSNQENCQFTYAGEGVYNVTLTIVDDTEQSANITKTIEVFNTPPVASFCAETNIATTNSMVQFDSQAYDVDGTVVNSTWYFGDNSIAYGNSVNHSFSKSGFYSVHQFVTDNENSKNDTFASDYILVADALVDDDFIDNPGAHKWDTIQEGINDVENGDIVYVFNGHYNSILINKSVALYGESRESVLISGGNPEVKIQNNNVSLSGFNVSRGTAGFNIYVKYDENHTSNVTIKNCNIYDNIDVGILLNESNYCSVENCTIKGSSIGVKIMNNSTYNVIRKCMIWNGTYGVYVSNSSHNFIGSPSIFSPYPTDCMFTYNHNAIYLKNANYNFILGCDIDGTPYLGDVATPTKGIYLNDSENNTISTCNIHDTTSKGVYLSDSTWNKIEHCKITWNPIGVYFDNSPDNLIAQNHFGGNSEFAVYLPSDTQYNHIYYNDFFANGNGSTNQSWDANDAKGAENLWSKEGNKTLTKTGSGEGNYWSDYTGTDKNEDGIGDTPYEINSSGVKRNDSYPVMEPYGWCNFTQDSTLPVITNVSATPHTVGFGYNVTIHATVTDNCSNISLVKVNIVYPDQSTGNYTMDSIGDSVYQYMFTDTWIVGQYNYTIWAMDDTYNSNSSSGHHFHVSANAAISIATLKDTYGANQYINLTDPPENGTNTEPYLYWSPPGNNLGIQNIKTVNYTYFWKYFTNHTKWQMEGWNPQTQQWQGSYQGHNLNEYLHLTRVRNTDNHSEKITLNFTSPYTTRYRFIFGIDLQVKNYVNRTGHHEYMLTYPVSETDNYTVFFNWSDIVPLVQQGKITLSHGIKNMSGVEAFWFMITGNSNLPAGRSFEIDPTFGSEDLTSWSEEQQEPCMGGFYLMNSAAGEADELVTYVKIGSGDPYEVVVMQGAIYDENLRLLGGTDEVKIELDENGCYEGYVTLPFSDKPSLSAKEWYYLVFGYQNFDESLHAEYFYIPNAEGGSGGVYTDHDVPPPMPDPFEANQVSENGLMIWCSYTIIDNPPVQSNADPANGSTGVALTPTLRVSCSDLDGDMMSATWWTNSSGSWSQFASNASIANNTIIRQTNTGFNNYGRVYYWRVCLTDGALWENRTYHFRTGLIETSVNSLPPYTITSCPYTINATGSSNLNNVTLHYGYSTKSISDWWNTGWSYRKKITIHHGQVAGNFSNLPVLVNITDSGLASHAQEDGDDIVFVSFNNARLNHEIETFNGTTGKLCAWVNIPSLRSTNDTILWMYYGNPGCSNQQNSTGVWGSSFKAVWHLSESPTGTVHDSTSNHNDMVSAGSMTASDLVNGRVGKALDFDGSNDYLSASDSVSLKPSGVSLLAWYYPRLNCTGRFDIGKMCMDQWGNYDACSYGFGKGASGGSLSNYTGLFERSDNTQTNPTKGSYALNAWHFFATTHDGSSSAKVYVDGVVGSPPTVGVQGLRYAGASNFYIAASHTGVGSGINRWTSCVVDEVWVVSGVLNASCIVTLYHSQSSPSTFMSFGSEENMSVTWTVWNHAGNPDVSYPWSWGFDFPNGTGYYLFYSIGRKSGSADELTPDAPDAWCHFGCQSKIKNTGSTNIKGYLLIQIQFYDSSQGKWLVDQDTINETSPRTINSGNQLALDTIFNGRVRASNLTHGAGTYRVYVAFRDPSGNVLKTSSGVELKAWWQFTVNVGT